MRRVGKKYHSARVGVTVYHLSSFDWVCEDGQNIEVANLATGRGGMPNLCEKCNEHFTK